MKLRIVGVLSAGIALLTLAIRSLAYLEIKEIDMKIIKAITIASVLWAVPAQAMTLDEYTTLTQANGIIPFMCLAEFYKTLPAGSNPDKVPPKDVAPAYDCFLAQIRGKISMQRRDAARRDGARDALDEYRADLERAERDRKREIDTLIMRMNRQNSISGSDYYRENMRAKIYHK